MFKKIAMGIVVTAALLLTLCLSSNTWAAPGAYAYHPTDVHSQDKFVYSSGAIYSISPANTPVSVIADVQTYSVGVATFNLTVYVVSNGAISSCQYHALNLVTGVDAAGPVVQTGINGVTSLATSVAIPSAGTYAFYSICSLSGLNGAIMSGILGTS